MMLGFPESIRFGTFIGCVGEGRWHGLFRVGFGWVGSGVGLPNLGCIGAGSAMGCPM